MNSLLSVVGTPILVVGITDGTPRHAPAILICSTPLEIVVSIDAPGKLVVVLASDGSPHEAGSIRTRVTDDTKLSCLTAIEGSKTVVVDHDQGHNADTARGYTMSISSPWRQRAGFYLVGTVTVLAKSSAALSEWMPGHKATVELFRDILEREVTALAKM